MAAFTSKAAGNWSSAGQTTWNEIGVPGSGDTATINHAITGDTDITINGLTINATFTMAAGKILTLQGNVAHGNAAFILSAGAGVIFSTAGGDRKWLTGTGVNQASCKFVANGTSGAHCTISKIGGNNAWFDGGNDGDPAIFNCGGWELTYCDMTGIHNAGYTMSIGSNDFGLHHRRLLNCTFSNCGNLFLAHPYQWGSTDKDFRVEDCRFTNVPRQTNHIYISTNAAGSGLRTCLRNSFSDYASINLQSGDSVDYNYFGNGGSWQCTLGTHNFVRSISRTNEYSYPALTNIYILHDHQDPADPILGLNDVGNPHMWNTNTQSTVNTGVVLEYPHEFNIDGGDGLYSTSATPDNCTITYCLSLPSMTDDGYSALILSMGNPTRSAILKHNTAVGRGAALAADERDHSGLTVVSQLESNLVVGFGTGNARGISGATDTGAGAIDILLPHAGYSNTDVIPSSAVKNNDIYYPISATFLETNALTREGWCIRMTNPVDATNRTYSSGSPDFVDIGRNCAKYAVTFLGATPLPTRPAFPVNHSNSSWIAWLTAKRAALDVFHNALMADPTLGTQVWTWVRAGFAPTNAALDPATPANQGTDGLTRGAIAFSGTPVDPPAAGRTGRLGKGGKGRPKRG